MPHKIHIQPEDKVGLLLTGPERQLVLGMLTLEDELAQVILNTPPEQPAQFTLDDLDELHGCIAAEANHTKDKKLQKKLDRICQKIDALLEQYTDEEPPAPTTLKPFGSEGGGRSVSKATTAIFQLKITLQGTKPPTWRRVQVKDCSLAKLHDLIQVAMGWEDCHLYAFEVGNEQYGDLRRADDSDWSDARKMKLSQLAEEGQKKFAYTYDFGDNWEHTIAVEKIVPVEPEARYPRCIEGARACPPEDCGGAWGYEEFLDAIRNPDHERHEELLEWIGGEFDPKKFDPTEVNKRLGKMR